MIVYIYIRYNPSDHIVVTYNHPMVVCAFLASWFLPPNATRRAPTPLSCSDHLPSFGRDFIVVMLLSTTILTLVNFLTFCHVG
jgi:hypothetical protein